MNNLTITLNMNSSLVANAQSSTVITNNTTTNNIATVNNNNNDKANDNLLLLYKDYRINAPLNANGNLTLITEENREYYNFNFDPKLALKEKGWKISELDINFNRYIGSFDAALIAASEGDIGRSATLMAEQYKKIYDEIREKYEGEERQILLNHLEHAYGNSVGASIAALIYSVIGGNNEYSNNTEKGLNEMRLALTNAGIKLNAFLNPNFGKDFFESIGMISKELSNMFYNARDNIMNNGSFGSVDFNQLNASGTMARTADLLTISSANSIKSIERFINNDDESNDSEKNKLDSYA
jgi:hypothetical protein